MTNSTRNPLSLLLAVAMTLAMGASQSSALELNRTFSDDMVLQRDKPVNVWGTAGKGETVTITFSGQTVKVKTDQDGRWVATLKPLKASAKGRVISVQSSAISKRIELKNVLVGDVFLFARQSSIDVSLGTTPQGRKAAPGKANENFRFMHITTSPSRTLLDNLKEDATTGWQVVDKKSALAMSAAAFYLGRDLVRDVDVPIGIVDLAMGYHFGSAWLSENGIKQATINDNDATAQLKWSVAKLQEHIESWDKRKAGYEWVKTKGKRGEGNWEKAENPAPVRGMSPIELPYSPASCYKAVIYPLRGLTVKGILLQLGNDYPYVAFTRLRNMGKSTDKAELGVANAQSYWINKTGNRMTPIVLPVVIDDLRRSLGDESVPLGWIMPGGSDVYEYAVHNREVREVQRRAQAGAKGVDLILPGTEHVPMSGQPADEALLAARCKQWVMGMFYGAKGPVSGPLFDRAEFGNDTATVFFKSGTAEGLTAEGDALQHFEVAGGDREFVPCKAEIDGSTIKLTSDTGSTLMYVRFGWSRKPVEGLVNSAGLPAVPFNSNSEWEYDWWPEPVEVALPKEYYTPANKWPDRDYAIINYATEGGGKHLGPTGLWGTPAGPNLYVTRITPGSPSDGKVLVGDMIYGINGKEFTPGQDEKYIQFAAGITKAEAEKGGGTMLLNIRREGELIEVPIELEYMGSFSSTTPWNCEKSSNIVARAEEYMRKGLRPETGVTHDGNYMYGPWNDNVIFLLASGNPELQGLVRRYIRQKMDELDKGKRGERGGFNGYNGWGSAYLAMLFGEYYHRTGDASVLPYLENLVRKGQEHQPRTWPQTEPSWHGVHPAIQMPFVMGVLLAQEAGIKVDQDALYFDLRHLHDGRAENGYILYNGYGPFLAESRQVPAPLPIDPKQKAAGMLQSMNGKLGTGAALFSLLDGYDKAVSNCSERCVYAFNHTRKGHGGAWFNNYWTPIGAYHAGNEKYQYFMKGQQWWRELYRDHTGAIWESHNAKEKQSVLAVGFAVHRALHRKKLRMFGAPRSAFAANPPAYLKDALDAHHNRDYALAEKLIQEVLAGGKITQTELPMVKHFLDSVQMVKQSIEYDLAYTEDALKRGEYYLANLELPQLKMVVAPGNARLQAIAAALESEEGKVQIAASMKRASAERTKAIRAKGAAKQEWSENWAAELATIDTLVKDGRTYSAGKKAKYPEYPREEWNLWRIKVLEAPTYAPEGWEKPGFDDSDWDETTLPIAWPMAHAALLRTTFEVKDKNAYKALQVRAGVYKQRNLEVYLNGELVAKVNNMPHTIDFELTPYAMEVLKNGENTLAVMSQHGKRVVDFAFRLEGRLKDK